MKNIKIKDFAKLLKIILFSTCIFTSVGFSASNNQIPIHNHINTLSTQHIEQSKNISQTYHKQLKNKKITNQGNLSFDWSNLKKSYQFDTGKKYYLPLFSQPIITDNQLILLTEDGRIICYNLQTTKIEWQHNITDANEQNDSISNIEEKYHAGSILFSNGILFVAPGTEDIIALDIKNGVKLWHKKLTTQLRGDIIQYRDKIVLNAINGTCYILNASDGEVIWSTIQTSLSNTKVYGLSSSSIVSMPNNTFIQQSINGNITAFSFPQLGEKFEQIWQLTPKIYSKYRKIMHHNIILSAEKNILYALFNDGEIISVMPNQQKIIWKHNYAITKPIWLAGQYIYAINDENQLLALYKENGKIAWSAKLDQILPTKFLQIKNWSAPIAAGNHIVTIDSIGRLLAFDMNNGTVKHYYKLNIASNSTPIIVNNNMYIMSKSGKIHSYTSVD